MPSSQRGHRPPLKDFLSELGLPADFCSRRAPKSSRSVTSVWKTHEARLKGGVNYVTGLFLAFVTVAEDLLQQVGEQRLPNALATYEPVRQDEQGRPVHNLRIEGPKRRISLRKYFDNVGRVAWYDLARFDFPNAPGHATRGWPNYRDELDQIFGMQPKERLLLATKLWKVLLDLPEAVKRTPEEATERPFEKLLREFPGTQKREPPGALLQALAFAYYRADAPNVTLETGKVRRGSARGGGVGDVDGWAGRTLVLSIEVKDIDLDEDDLPDLATFLRNLADWPDATAIIVARSFTDDLVDQLAEQNVLVLDREAMARNVELWDLRKQQLAVREFEYFLARIQRHSGLDGRFRQWAEENGLHIEIF
jgi:hypothetical protein